jgi:Na+/citrate or Na+/malate symporter
MIAGMIISAVVSVIVGILLVNGVNNMKEKHPDYKGEDFLNWDDNKTHTEDKI